MGVRLPDKSKPDNCTEPCIVDLVGTWSERSAMVLGEVSSADGNRV